MAAWLLAAVLSELGVVPRPLYLDAQRLALCQRLLGLPPGPSRAGVRPGLASQALVGSDARLVLAAANRGMGAVACPRLVCPPHLGKLLLRRLVWAALRRSGIQSVVPRGLRPIVYFLPLESPARPGLGAEPARRFCRAPERTAVSAGSDVCPAKSGRNTDQSVRPNQ